MLLVDDLDVPGHERVVRISDDTVGMSGFIAIHSLTRGPSLGGLRIREYGSNEDALRDVLNLSEAMTYKSAAAGLPFGGGKAVLNGDTGELKTPELLKRFGAAVHELAGTYITAEDVGTTVADLARVAAVTPWVAGLPTKAGGSGDPSPATARGVLAAMKAVAAHLWGDDSLENRRVLVQGLGKVGTVLVRMLCEEDAEVLAADVDPERIEAATAICGELVPADPGAHLSEQVDVFSPCALGGVLSRESVKRLDCKAVVGSANNQLNSPDIAEDLAARGIVYAPDFVANAGGIINIASEFGYTPSDVRDALYRIGETVGEILRIAEANGKSTHEAAMDIAKQRLEPPMSS